MGAPETKWSYSDTDESVELHTLGGILRFSSTSELRNYIESTSASTPKGRIRMVGRSHRQIKDATKQPSDSCDGNVTGNAAELTAERLNDILIAGATAITDIDNMINELQAARDYLQTEAERVWRANARYAHLAQTASASAKSIAESMGKWRNPEPFAPTSLNPSNDADVQPELNGG